MNLDMKWIPGGLIDTFQNYVKAESDFLGMWNLELTLVLSRPILNLVLGVNWV